MGIQLKQSARTYKGEISGLSQEIIFQPILLIIWAGWERVGARGRDKGWNMIQEIVKEEDEKP